MARSSQLDPVHYHEVSIDAIDPHPDQPRKTIDERGIRELADNIKKFGLLHPITVIRTPDNENRYILCAGQRRLLALKLLEKTQVPIIVAKKGDPDEIAMIENSQREDVHPIDQAEAAARLIKKHGYTHENLANNIIHKSRSTITELLLLNELPEDIKEECRVVDVHKSQLLAVARLGDNPDAQRQLWNEVKAGTVTARSALRRQRGGAKDADDTPKELKPIVRVIATGTRLLESLKKIEATSLVNHGDKIAELRKLHQQIGHAIKSLQKGDKQLALERPAVAEDVAEVAAQ